MTWMMNIPDSDVLDLVLNWLGIEDRAHRPPCICMTSKYLIQFSSWAGAAERFCGTDFTTTTTTTRALGHV